MTLDGIQATQAARKSGLLDPTKPYYKRLVAVIASEPWPPTPEQLADLAIAILADSNSFRKEMEK